MKQREAFSFQYKIQSLNMFLNNSHHSKHIRHFASNWSKSKKFILCQEYSINSYSESLSYIEEKKADGEEQECRDVKNCAKFVSSRLCDALWGKQGDYRSANRHRPDRLSSAIYLKRFKHNLKIRLSKRIVNKWKYFKRFLALSKDQRPGHPL